MKAIYTYTNNKEPIYIADSNGTQRVLVVFQEAGRLYVYFCDDYLRHTYLNRLIKTSLNSEPICNANLIRIEDDVEFYACLNWVESNYNYNGMHVEEKISGHDQGGAVLVDHLGNALIK